jgi:hypothetical protein
VPPARRFAQVERANRILGCPTWCDRELDAISQFGLQLEYGGGLRCVQGGAPELPSPAHDAPDRRAVGNHRDGQLGSVGDPEQIQPRRVAAAALAPAERGLADARLARPAWSV